MSEMLKDDTSDGTNKITEAIVDSAYSVHKNMGPGLLESIYEACLVKELTKRGLKYERQKAVQVFYEGEALGETLRVDLVVEGKVLLELKSVEGILPVHWAQVLTYLKLTGLEVGLLINFNVKWFKDGVDRIVLSK